MSAGTAITLGLCVWGFFCAGAMAFFCIGATRDWLRGPTSFGDAAISLALAVGFVAAAAMSGAAAVDLWSAP